MGADVAGGRAIAVTIPRSGNAALVERRAARVAASVDCRTAGQQGMGVGGAAVVRQRTQPGIGVAAVARTREAIRWPTVEITPCDVIAPAQFPPTGLFATMVCLNSAELPASFQIPPPSTGAEFPLNVTLLSVAVPKLRSPPPMAAPNSDVIVLPLIVLLLILRLPPLAISAPELAAEPRRPWEKKLSP